MYKIPKLCLASTLVFLIRMSTSLFIHVKKSRPHVFSLRRFEIFPQTCLFTYKRREKYPTHTFILDHTVIRATRVWEKQNCPLNPMIVFWNSKSGLLRSLRSKDDQGWKFLVYSEKTTLNLKNVKQTSVWKTVPKFIFFCLFYCSLLF